VKTAAPASASFFGASYCSPAGRKESNEKGECGSLYTISRQIKWTTKIQYLLLLFGVDRIHVQLKMPILFESLQKNQKDCY